MIAPSRSHRYRQTPRHLVGKLAQENVKSAASLSFLGQEPLSPVSSPSAAGCARASLFALLTLLDRASLRGLRSPSTAMAHRGRYWPRYHDGAKPHQTNGGSMANETITAGPWAGFEVIHRYTRAQAIADGVLVDVTAKARTCGFTVPVAMTATLFADC